MTWEPTDSASSSSSLPKPRFGPSCCYSTYSPSSSVLPSCLTIANRPPFAPRFSLAEPFWAAPDGGWLFICHKAGVVCKPETLCSTTSSLGNSQFRRSWIPLSPPDLNHQLKSLPIESNFGIQVKCRGSTLCLRFALSQLALKPSELVCGTLRNNHVLENLPSQSELCC